MRVKITAEQSGIDEPDGHMNVEATCKVFVLGALKTRIFGLEYEDYKSHKVKNTKYKYPGFNLLEKFAG